MFLYLDSLNRETYYHTNFLWARSRSLLQQIYLQDFFLDRTKTKHENRTQALL